MSTEEQGGREIQSNMDKAKAIAKERDVRKAERKAAEVAELTADFEAPPFDGEVASNATSEQPIDASCGCVVYPNGQRDRCSKCQRTFKRAGAEPKHKEQADDPQSE